MSLRERYQERRGRHRVDAAVKDLGKEIDLLNDGKERGARELLGLRHRSDVLSAIGLTAALPAVLVNVKLGYPVDEVVTIGRPMMATVAVAFTAEGGLVFFRFMNTLHAFLGIFPEVDAEKLDLKMLRRLAGENPK